MLKKTRMILIALLMTIVLLPSAVFAEETETTAPEEAET